MVKPSPLKYNDKVVIVATARKVTKAEIIPAVKILESWGLRVRLGVNLFGSRDQYSGNDSERASDLQSMIDDPEIKAIFIARGGYGTIRILDKLDFSLFQKNPKWLVGFSDVTVLHSHLHKTLNTESIHATMPALFKNGKNKDHSLNSLKNALFQGSAEYSFLSDPTGRPGKAQAPIVGGNLSILYALLGTPFDIDTRGKILFLEDLDEYLYHIDRMMMALKWSGKLNQLKGLLVWGLTEMNDNEIPFGKSAEEIVMEAVNEYSYPVAFGFPAGHVDPNEALILGRNAEFSLRGNQGSLRF